MSVRRRVAVVGGGIAGLALAATLDPSRFEVVVHEDQPERSGAGSALGMWPSALRALDRVGAGAAVRGDAARLESGALRDAAGRPLMSVASSPVTMVARPLLLSALRSVVPESVSHKDVGVIDPAQLDADLVVGADGVRSVVRPLVALGSGARVETPYLALRGVRPEAPDRGVTGEYWGRGRLFGIVPTREGTSWFDAHRSALAAEPVDPGAALDEARMLYAADAPAVRRILDEAGDDTLVTRLWVAPPMARYVRGRYVVIGDAAHAMLPNLGRGACDAILDAVSLGETLNADRLLASWELRRLPATQAGRVVAGALMRLALAETAQPGRDALLRLAGRALSRPGP